MKKLTALFLSVMLVIAMSTTAFAATVTKAGGNDSADVTGTYVAGSTGGTVYSVNVAWGSMAFTYTGASAGTWNPATHTYSGATEAGWSCADGANKIAVTNHSNTAVSATLNFSGSTTYYPSNDYHFVESSGTANDNLLNLATAVGTAVADAPNASAILELTGTIDSSLTTATVIGEVTVSLE